MISSMTSFSHKTLENKWGSLGWELRSVNHRYLDITVRLPEVFHGLEKKIRDLIQQYLRRGKVEVALQFIPGEEASFEFMINKPLAKKLANAGKEMGELFPNLQINMMDMLAWQGMLQIKETNMDVIGENALALLKKSLEEMVATRQREGTALKAFLKERLQHMQEQMAIVASRAPISLEAERQRIRNRFLELNLELDQDRVEQEILWLTQKADITEELQRLAVHLHEVQRVVDQGGVVGRRLDFLMQELNRETNTIASKSIDSRISQASIEMKVLIEQMREQVQNIE